jgi:tetratricopeptide (TPR) repeat protein/tRNA A-37 threonylcarbamoyl transferase component Bud32
MKPMDTEPEGQPSNINELETLAVTDRSASRQSTAAERLPENIEGYRVLGLLGEGAMGMVYEAEQQHPRRRVAIKVLHRHHLVDDLHARMFLREVETLGRLKHPNIAAIYESGHTADGRDYFAMELVRGLTLDRWLAQRPSPVTSDELKLRLRLFAGLCQAVHYAHQRGVIHRDLKPANILVTDQQTSASGSGRTAPLPMVKILDFGLARFTDQDVLVTMATEVGMIKGTLPYMSPEQARGEADAVDVRTDIYALGVMLYELVAGQRPYETVRAALAEAIRVICEEPPRPLRQSWSGIGRLDADVENIVGKALEKEPARRYESAAALAEDIDRYLSSQPINARPPGALYQIRKFAGRNRAWVGAAATALLALVVALAVSSAMYVRAEREAERAHAAAAKSEQVAELLESMLAGVGPSVALGRDTTMLREILDTAAVRIGTDLADQPEVEAELRRVLASTYRDLGEFELVPGHAERSLQLFREVAGPLAPATLRAQSDLGAARYSLGDLDAAETELREVLEKQRKVLGEDHPDVVQTTTVLVETLLYQNRLEEADALGTPALEIARASLGLGDDTTLALLYGLAQVAGDLLDFKRSEALYLELIPALEKRHGPEHPHLLTVLSGYGWLLRLAGRYAEAETVTRTALEGMRKVLGNEHQQTQVAVNNLGIILKDQGRFDEAEPYYVENVETGRRVLGDRHPEQVAGVINLAAFYAARKRYAEAEPLAVSSAAILAEEVSPDFIGRGFALHTAGECRLRLGKIDQALPELEEAYRIMSTRFGPEHPKMAQLLGMLVEVNQRRGRTEKAAGWQAILGTAE